MTLLMVTATITDSLGGQTSSTTSAVINDFVLGVTKADDYSGLREPTTSVDAGGILTVDGTDRLFENVRFERRVKITGTRIRFVNCQGVGEANPPAGIELNLFECTNSNCGDIEFEFCELKPQTPRLDWANAIKGANFRAYRCDLAHCVDGIGIYRSGGSGPLGVAIDGNYIHDLAFWTPYPSQADNKSHNDCIQMHQFIDGVTIVGNTLQANLSQTVGNPNDGWGLASIMNGAAGYTLANTLIDRNWISGGVVGINFGVHASATNLDITGNRWGRDFKNGQTAYVQKHSSFHFTGTNSITGNVYEDTGASANQGACCGTWP